MCRLISARETIDVVKEGDIFVVWGYKANLEMRMEAPGVPHIMTLFPI